MARSSEPEYRALQAALDRCYNPRNCHFHRYGPLGRRVFKGWHLSRPGGYEKFLAEVGRKPSPDHSLDRIDNEKGYMPGNVRWATPQEQSRNRTKGIRLLTHNGETMLSVEWAKRLGTRSDVITKRLRRGWTMDEVVNRPVTRCGLRKKAP